MGGKENGAKAASEMPDVDTAGFIKFFPVFLIFLFLPRAIGGAIAVAIYKYGKTAMYDKNIASLLDSDRGYLYAAAALFGFVVAWVNNYPMLYKNMIMRFGSGNLRANMMVYKQVDAPGSSPIVLETDGPVGSYNRANRSLTHMIENSLPTAMCIILVGNMFPFPTLVLTAVFGLGRILHQAGYASVGYGGHGFGFMLASGATVTLEMLCLLVADKSLSLGASKMVGGLLKMEL